ncbi:MAG: potassium/proton antiporter [Bacteroidales bacterium]|jgi:cell volume regulation protein A|nr:potassium/proton antiporter [Bacteroidales bacterium]
MPLSIESLLLFASILFLVSLFATKAGNRFGVPALLLFLFVGMIFGSGGLGVQFENYKMAQTIGTVALCIILFSGGLDTKYNDIRPVAAQGVVLATLGVLLTALITGIFIYYVVNAWFSDISISFLEAMLLASVMSSTDSASVFAILRGKGVRLKNNLKPLLELESGSNDPMAYMLTIVLIQLITSGQLDTTAYGNAALSFFLQFIIGAGAGYILGKAAVWLINKINLGNDSFYPVLLFTCGIFIFSATYFIRGNGYLAVYLAGLIIGNAKIVHKRTSIRVFDGLAWLSQIVMFLTLGLLVNPGELWPVALASLLIGAFMTIGGRPLSVFISLLPFRKMPFRDKFFVSWVGLKGAVPIIFAIYPLAAGLENSHFIFNIVFFITLISLLVQGTSLTRVADWLGLSHKGADKSEFKDFDVEFAEDIKSTMTEIEVTGDLLRKSGRLMDLPLPDHTLVVMVKRDGKYFVPKGNTVLMPDDKLLVITTDEDGLVETYNSMGIRDYRLKRN